MITLKCEECGHVSEMRPTESGNYNHYHKCKKEVTERLMEIFNVFEGTIRRGYSPDLDSLRIQINNIVKDLK